MMSKLDAWIDRVTPVVFRWRVPLLALFVVVTCALFAAALKTRVDAGFTKRLPLEHEYIQTFLQYQDEFGGANRVLIAFTVRNGDIFQPQFFDLLRRATDESYYVPGVDRAKVTSIWTPNVRFIEIVEDGFAGGNVVPADFDGSPDDLQLVRENLIKSGRVGQLVANDFSGAVISLQLQEVDPATGARVDYLAIARHLEENFRDVYEREGRDLGLQVHIIGFAKIMGDVADGASNVILFFVISLLITAICVYLYAQSFRLTMLPLATSLIAVIWQMGLLHLMGYGIDPMSILVPFLVLAIGVSHGVQMVRSFRTGFLAERSSLDSAMDSFRQLLMPGSTALLTDMIGFITILAIRIPIIQELAITASVGVFTLFFTNLLLLPLLLSYTRLRPEIRERIEHRREATDRFWARVAWVATPRGSLLIIAVCTVMAWFGLRDAIKVQIGDLHHGVPELRQNSRYNRDSAVITERFSIGVSLITVIAEAGPNGCVDYQTMETIDRFAWHMQNVPGVQSVMALPLVAKTINAGFNEGNAKWHILPRHPAALSQAVTPVDTATGLLNADGSVMPVYVFLRDHKSDTIARVVATVKEFREREGEDLVRFRLATGNVGVMGATNEVVAAAQFPMLVYVFGAVIALCFISFRTWRAAFCIVVPLALVSVLAYALMHHLGIGLVTSTLPVVALGVGVGVDYGIYLFFRLRDHIRQGAYFEDALATALQQTGSAVVFTGITLAIGVSTWIFSDLQFQADMGILLTFMFIFNMLGAILLLPAIARWLFRHHSRHHNGEEVKHF
jgi:uncharacterized protein